MFSLSPGYCVAKIGVSRLAGLQATIAASDPRGGILVNAVSLTKMVMFDFHILRELPKSAVASFHLENCSKGAKRLFFKWEQEDRS